MENSRLTVAEQIEKFELNNTIDRLSRRNGVWKKTIIADFNLMKLNFGRNS